MTEILLCGLAGLERVQNSDVEVVEVCLVSRGHDQVMNAGCGSDHGVLQQMVGLSIHDSPPLAKAVCVHGQYLIRSGQLVDPQLDFCCASGILASGALDASLQFPHGHGGKKQLLIVLAAKPSHNGAVRAWFSQFGNDVGV
ncbi:MAG TPA: hypothetical protein VMB18_14640 [Terriglobales bacterium]|nr:hypothetical protein [Terriglobales bacterium]